MLGITKISSGRMGNRLFHYHFLRQVSARTGIKYFNVKFPDSKYFEDMESGKRPFLFFRKQVKINSIKLGEFTPREFLGYVDEKNKCGFDIVFNPPLLGDHFFGYLFYPPSDFLIIKKEYRKDFDFNTEDKTVIGLHFRGTDFEAWNKNASLKFSYYEKAIKYCIDYFTDKKPVFVIFTDDLKFSPYLETIDYLKSGDFEFHLSNNLSSPICDFYQISQCDVLISSPSTFAILAGAIGKTKKIIHSQQWLDYSVSRNDKFWVDLVSAENPFYSLWKSF